MPCTRTTRKDVAPMPRIGPDHQARWEPRDEQVKLSNRLRPWPAPLDVAICHTAPALDAALETQPASKLFDRESPKDPEIIDVAAFLACPRTVVKRTPSSQSGTPSLHSRCSTRHSELSYGILDYYMRDDATSLPPTPTMDPAALGRFDFELVPQTPSPTETDNNEASGAERIDELVEITPPSTARTRLHPQHKHSYSLFPKVEPTSPQDTRPRALTIDRTSPTSTYSRPSALSRIPSHMLPTPSYPPRKESLTGSVRSRQDSFTSYRSASHRQTTPLRIMSPTSTASTDRSHSAASSALSTASTSIPEQKCRWSEDTIASPELLPTTGPTRTSFGPLLVSAGLSEDKDGTNPSQYPACFFEDDDESVPLRKKLAWKRSLSGMEQRVEPSGKRSGCGEEARSKHGGTVGSRVKRILLCGG
ncbi:hypothetical protein Tdes44962_MAKER09734, partial [Teratosphaeria destructans]